MDMKLPHQQADIASEGFQRLEDLATSSWYAEVLFAALDLNIFGLLGDCPVSVAELVEQSGYEADALSRFLAALMALGLITEHQGRFANGPLAARYLIPGKSDYWGDFLLYRRYLASHWPRLTVRIRQGVSANDRPTAEPPEAYRERTLAYVRTMDLQARLKAAEALEYLGKCLPRPRRILDLGGGAGAWCRAFRRQWPQVQTVLLDLPETLAAARRLYPDPSDWEGIEVLAGSGLTSCFRGKAFDLILLSNVLHAYGEAEAREILAQCVDCLEPGGVVLIHDYLADLQGSNPAKGSLYDLHMLVNTYNGRIYHLGELEAMLDGRGAKKSAILSSGQRHFHSVGWARRIHGVRGHYPGRDFGGAGQGVGVSCRPDYRDFRGGGGALGAPQVPVRLFSLRPIPRLPPLLPRRR